MLVRSGPRDGFRWDAHTIAYAIALWHRRHQKTPTVAEWERAGDDHPSRQTVLRVFGSWSSAMLAAGFPPRRQGEPRREWARNRCPTSGRWLPG